MTEDRFHPFRDHETQFGWGVKVTAHDGVFAYVGDKGAAFGLAAALNGDWEKAKGFFSIPISDEDYDAYLERFSPNLNMED